MQNFIQKKKKPKPKPMWTYCANLKRFYLGKKKKKLGKDKSRKRQKVGHGRKKGNFVQHTLPPFLPHFLPILERLNCGGPREKMARPHHFSLPLPLSSKHPSHPFSLIFSTLFFFPSSLKSTHPNIVLVSVSLSLSED